MNKLLNRYKKLPLPAKASFWFVVTSILQKSISFITVPIFTRLLSPEEFGLINVYQSWLGILTLFATLTVWGGVFNNGMIKYTDDRSRFVSSLQGLSTTITISLLLVYLFFSDVISKFIEFPKIIILLMFIQIIFIPPLNLWSSKNRFDFKYKKLVLITIIMSIANPILGIILVVTSENGGKARIISIAIVQIVIGAILYINNIKAGRKFYHKNYWKYALTFNIPLIPHYLSQSVLNQADRIMINNMVGVDKAGIYSIAYSVGMIFMFVISSINSTLTPWTYKQLKEKSYDEIEKVSYFLLVVLSTLILLLISFAPEVIKIMAPLEYYEAVWVIPPIALSIYFIFLYGLFANVEFYFEENKFIMYASIFAAVVNILLNYLLIPRFGYMAAGYTTLLSYTIYSFLHFIFMNKIIKKKRIEGGIYNPKKILLITLIMFIVAFIITVFYSFVIIRYSVILILIIIISLNKDKICNAFKMLKE